MGVIIALMQADGRPVKGLPRTQEALQQLMNYGIKMNAGDRIETVEVEDTLIIMGVKLLPKGLTIQYTLNIHEPE